MSRVSYQFYLTEYEGELIPEPAWKQTMIKAESYLDSIMYVEPDEKTLPKVQFCCAKSLSYCTRMSKTKRRVVEEMYCQRIPMVILSLMRPKLKRVRLTSILWTKKCIRLFVDIWISPTFCMRGYRYAYKCNDYDF